MCYKTPAQSPQNNLSINFSPWNWALGDTIANEAPHHRLMSSLLQIRFVDYSMHLRHPAIPTSRRAYAYALDGVHSTSAHVGLRIDINNLIWTDIKEFSSWRGVRDLTYPSTWRIRWGMAWCRGASLGPLNGCRSEDIHQRPSSSSTSMTICDFAFEFLPSSSLMVDLPANDAERERDAN